MASVQCSEPVFLDLSALVYCVIERELAALAWEYLFWIVGTNLVVRTCFTLAFKRVSHCQQLKVVNSPLGSVRIQANNYDSVEARHRKRIQMSPKKSHSCKKANHHSKHTQVITRMRYEFVKVPANLLNRNFFPLLLIDKNRKGNAKV